MEQYYCTFKYYDKKGRRLAVFCRFISPTEAELFTLTCSEEDQFQRKYARQVYEAYLKGEDPKFEFHKPLIEIIEIQPEQREVQTLIEYCESNYHFYATIPAEVTILTSRQEIITMATNFYKL
jgi:hypothetical protein